MRNMPDVEREIDNKQRLILQHTQRLQVLQEQKAQLGIMASPHIITEIQQIEEQLKPLEAALEALEQEKGFLTAPLVHIANFGPVPADLPAGTTLVDHSGEFVFDPRRVPPPERWQAELRLELFNLPARVKQKGLIRLQGSSSLSSAFAFGQVFRNTGGYHLAVEQHTPDETIVWYSNEKPSGEPARFVSYQSGLNKGQSDGAVIIYAAPKTTLAAVVGEVGVYWKEADTFKQILTDPAAMNPQHLRGVLALEAETASREAHLTGEQAASLAATSRRRVVQFVEQINPDRLHLFMAGPAGLAAFIGHHWNQIGIDIQCYERLSRNRYTRSLALESDHSITLE